MKKYENPGIEVMDIKVSNILTLSNEMPFVPSGPTGGGDDETGEITRP